MTAATRGQQIDKNCTQISKWTEIMTFLSARGTVMIRMAYYGCANRPFFHIVATRKTSPRNGRILEQIGTYDPMTNTSGEKLVAINFERLKYWYAVRGAHVSKPVTELLGLCGYFPIAYTTRLESFRARKRQKAKAVKEQQEEQQKSVTENS